MNMIGLDLSAFAWICIFLLMSVSMYTYITWPYNYFKYRGIAGPKPVPLFGNMIEMGKQPFWVKHTEWIAKYGKVFGWFLFGSKNLMVTDEEMLREIFVKEFDSFCDRKPLLIQSTVMRNGVFCTKGNHWKLQRHLLSPYFTTATLKKSNESINGVLDNFIDWLEEKCIQGEMVEARECTQMLTMDVFCSTAFGVEVNSCKNRDTTLVKRSRDFFKSLTTANTLTLLIMMFPMFGKLLEFFKVEFVDVKYLENFIRHLIKERKELTEGSGNDLVNVLLKERPEKETGLSDDEIIGNALTFFLAGYDTTAASLSFLLYNLTVNSDCQKKIFQEIQDTIGNQKPTYDNIQEMTYLEMCIDESLRLYPVAPKIDRLCVKDTIVKGVHIEKGVNVVIPMWPIHRNPEIWKDPDLFNPERFTPEKKKARDPLHYLPFGLGPRHCIGMRLAMLELKMAVVRILQKFKVVKNDKTQVPLKLNPKAMIPVPSDGIWLTLETRD